MKKAINRRNINCYQGIFLVLLALTIFLSPKMVMGYTTPVTPVEACNTQFDDCKLTASSYNVSATGDINQLSHKTGDIFGKQKKVKKKPIKKRLDYDKSIEKALKAMGKTVSHIEMWGKEHPDSTLNSLDKLTPDQQRQVANIATFIRKINRNVDEKTSWREACAMVVYSDKYNAPVELVVGLSKAESTFYPSATSNKGARGVMQVMWTVHHRMLSTRGIATNKDHLYDAERGIEAGVLLLSRYISAYGTVQNALTRYYGGRNSKYVKKIGRNMAMLNKHSESSGY